MIRLLIASLLVSLHSTFLKSINDNLQLGMVAHLISALGRKRQVDLCEFKPCLVYRTGLQSKFLRQPGLLHKEYASEEKKKKKKRQANLHETFRLDKIKFYCSYVQSV